MLFLLHHGIRLNRHRPDTNISIRKRNGNGASILGPRNKDRERQNPDLMRPPSTDHGDMKNMRWSFADSHVRIEEGGWTRQTTIRELPTSVELAGVNMRLDEASNPRS